MLTLSESHVNCVNDWAESKIALNVARQCKDSLPSVAVGVRCYSPFSDWLGIQYFPPTSANVQKWGSLCNHGKTFGLYCSHLAKACQILGIATDWYDESVRPIARGLPDAQDFSAKFGNFIFKDLPLGIIAHYSIGAEFDRLCSVSIVFYYDLSLNDCVRLGLRVALEF